MRILGILAVILVAIIVYFGFQTGGFGLLQPNYQERMAISGHGYLYDAEGQMVDLGIEEIVKLQGAILKDVEAEPVTEPNEELQEVAQTLAQLLEGKQSLDEQVITRALRIRALSYLLPPETGTAYLWRGNFLRQTYLIKTEYQVIPPLIDIEEILKQIIISLTNTPYANTCRAQNVPIPPLFGAGAGIWSNQGNLMVNILAPGAGAAVWTWVDPAKRGGCVALPRDSGQAGIICQSATTGRACFWDNIEKGGTKKFAWATDVEPLTKLQDGSELVETCPMCHKGNNVFLLDPDDPTWCKLMRGGQPTAGCAAMTGNPGSYTLKVEGTVDQIPEPGTTPVFLHSRYIPISKTPPRAGWVNGATPGCAGDCHLEPAAVNVITNSITSNGMPPACGTNCYLP